MDDDHDLVADIDSDTLIRIIKFLKRGKAPGSDKIHNEVLRLGTTTSLFHHCWPNFPSQREWFPFRQNQPHCRDTTGFCPESITFPDIRQ